MTRITQVRTLPISIPLHQVVDNPRFGVLHTLRVLALHGLVLFATLHLAVFGWAEFYEWGKGPLGQALQLPLLSANDEGSRDPERGGAGFALLLLYDLGLTAVDVSLSGLKYLVYLVEVYRGPSSVSAIFSFRCERYPIFSKYVFRVCSIHHHITTSLH